MDSTTFKLLPEQASRIARQVDYLFYYEMAVAAGFTLLIFVLIVGFCFRYRRRSESYVPPLIHGPIWLEIAWTAIPAFFVTIMFFWGAWVFIISKRVPKNAMEIHVIGKQWMWKTQHDEGVREINELHVPAGRPIKLIMTSQDVIHDFGLPAFRMKMDVIPGTYTYEWFEADEPGEYHIYCDQYCGALHASMVGRIVVMDPAKFQDWLSGAVPQQPPAVTGSQLFSSYGCAACHGQRAPTMAGLYMSQVKLDYPAGKTVVADEAYLRRAIMDPAAEIVSGYQTIMPSYRGQLTEEQILDLIAYMKSLSSARAPTAGNGDEGPASRPAGPGLPYYPPDRIPNQPPVREGIPIDSGPPKS